MFARDFLSIDSRRLRDWWRCASATEEEESPADTSESGAALVEFTILMPVFFLLVFGIIEFGSIFFLQNNMVNAAREAARRVSVQGGTLSSANNRACTEWLKGTGQTFVIRTTDTCTAASTTVYGDVAVLITVDAAQASIINYLGIFTGRTIPATVTMRQERTCQAAGGLPVSCTCNASVNPPTGCP